MIINCKRLIYLVAALVLTSQHSFAENSSNNGNGSSNSSSSSSSRHQTVYTVEEIANFTSTFATIPAYPSDFSWEDSQIYTPETSARPIVMDFTPVTVTPTVTLGSDSDGTLQIASLSELGYEGVKCAAGLYKFPIAITDSNNIPQAKVVEVNLPLAPQLTPPNSPEYNSQGQQTLLCKNHIAAVAGKVVNGNIVFQCQAGLWRIKQVGCKDSETACTGAPNTIVPVPTTYNGTPNALFNLSGKYADGAAVQTYACKDYLVAPSAQPAPVNLQWSGNINLSCSSGSFSAGSNNCMVIDVANNIFPNCAGGAIGKYIVNGQTVGRACFPAGTNMAQISTNTFSGFIATFNQVTIIGPNVYTGNIAAGVQFHWVKKDVSTASFQDRACGRFNATTTSTLTSTSTSCFINCQTYDPSGMFGMGGSTNTSILGFGGTSSYSTTTSYVFISTACPQ